MSLIFYYAPMSTAGLTEMALEELGIPYERVRLDMRKGDTKKAEFLKLNPNGKVPVLVHDGTVIWESAAIAMYLGETFGVEKNLYPAAGPKRGEAMKWITWTNVSLGDAVSRFARNTMNWIPAEQQNAKAAEAGKADVEACLRVLEECLGSHEFLLGSSYSLADAHLHSYLSWVRHMPIDFTPYAKVNAWSARCDARPAVKAVNARQEG